MTVYEKIEKIFQHQELDRPAWADEILQELRQINAKLDAKPLMHVQNHSYKQDDFYEFIKNFRIQMKADIVNNVYPEVEYNGKRYGINFNGLLYNKETTATISTAEAKIIYRFLYENKCKSV